MSQDSRGPDSHWGTVPRAIQHLAWEQQNLALLKHTELHSITYKWGQRVSPPFAQIRKLSPLLRVLGAPCL